MYSLSPVKYYRSLGFDPYEWQVCIIEGGGKRKVVNGARQSGKSTVVAGKPCYVARFKPGSLSVVLAATQKQAVEDMHKIRDFMAHDKSYPKITRDSDELLELENGSRIVVVTATERAARGYSAPDIVVIDEASRVEDVVYTGGVRAMLNNNPSCEVLVISTPNGKSGFFWRIWNSPRWERIWVRAPFDVLGGRLIPVQDVYCPEGVKLFYSPRHGDVEEQEEHLLEMGERLYRQEMLCEFVESETQVFKYADIDSMFSRPALPLREYVIGEASGRLELG